MCPLRRHSNNNDNNNNGPILFLSSAPRPPKHCDIDKKIFTFLNK